MEKATLVLAEDTAGHPEVAVVDTDVVGAQGFVVNLQSYWPLASQADSGSI
jgi:hypothetical protein